MIPLLMKLLIFQRDEEKKTVECTLVEVIYIRV